MPQQMHRSSQVPLLQSGQISPRGCRNRRMGNVLAVQTAGLQPVDGPALAQGNGKASKPGRASSGSRDAQEGSASAPSGLDRYERGVFVMGSRRLAAA